MKWCIPQYFEDRGTQASELRNDQEASAWWSASEEAYLQLSGSKIDFTREKVFVLGLDGQVEKAATVVGDLEALEEARRVVEKVVAHRCGLAQRQQKVVIVI